VPLSDDDFIQSNSNTVAANTSVVVSLPSGTTAGNTVIAFFAVTGSTTINSGGMPSGFALAVGGMCFYKSDVPAGETSWTFTQTAATDCSWIVVEMSSVDLVEPYEALSPTGQVSNISLGNATLTTTTPGSNVGLSTVVFGLFSAHVSSGTASKSWGSYTNDHQQVAQVANTTGTGRPVLAVTRLFNDGAPGKFSTAATQTIDSGTSVALARVLVFREAGSPISAPLGGLTGFEFGTHGGLAENTVHATGAEYPLGPAVPVGTWGTHYQIGAFGRNGDYGMRISTSAATCYVPLNSGQAGTEVHTLNVRVVSASGTPTILTFDPSVGTDLLLVYDAATERFGLQWATGTVAWQAGTTPLNTWALVEVLVKVSATTHHAEWMLETGTNTYTAQTSPANLTGMTSTHVTRVSLSGLTSQTVTFDADDPIYSEYYAAYPLGPHKVLRLGVDTAGTATVTGTAANFNVFTANGTLAAFNSANALAALDEVPPTVSAAADGIVQVTTASADYVELPMQTYTLGADEVIAGVRVIASMWSGAGAGTGAFEIHGYDGVSEKVLVDRSGFDAGSPTAPSATAPLWMAKEWGLTPGNPWTQTRLNNAVLRVGYSADATPDMGISAIYLEVAIRTTLPSVVAHRLTSNEDPEAEAALVTTVVHPYNSGVRSFTVSDEDPARTAVFNYSIGGTPQTAITVGPSGTPQTVTVNTEAFGEVDSTSFGWQ
jgi:hypothetical protein